MPNKSDELQHDEQTVLVDGLRGPTIEPDEEEELAFYVHRELHQVLDLLVKIHASEPLIDTIEWCISDNARYMGDDFVQDFEAGRLHERYTGDLSLIWRRRDPELYQ
ncbi:hypothetical protein IHQ71_07880 [Rhizobium sp. TH2]|uniref:hypothetical protein n=1 Tax=Rhizobium sp. TH2 TaxID=2775403 RepID=UPI0021587245|nr:hypothetical protein [Rhizobium sp. TH2]UVC10503.1 hypothetical protein IHQ71_07880 [Rhizobium sp. TH2]